MLLWDFSMFPLDNCQCSNGLWWINMLWLASKETPVMFQGKMTSSLLNQGGKNPTQLSFINKFDFSPQLFYFWNVRILFRAFVHSDKLRKKKKLSWENTCRKKLHFSNGDSHFRSSTRTHVTPELFTKTKVIFQVLISCRTTCSHYCLPKRLAGWLLAYLAGRHASFNINSPCDSPFPSNLSSNTWG